MKEFVEYLMSNEMLILYSLLGAVLLVIITILIADKVSKSGRKKKNTKELLELTAKLPKVEVASSETEELKETVVTMQAPALEKPLMQTTPVTPQTQVTDMKEPEIDRLLSKVQTKIDQKTAFEMPEPIVVKPLKEEQVIKEQTEPQPTTFKSAPPKIEPIEEIKYVDEALEQTNAQLELERLTEELKKAEELTKQEAIDLTKFELEQEENAIISLNELLEKGDTLYDQNEESQYQDEGNEPINLKELEAHFQKQKEPISVIAPAEKETPVDKEKVVLQDFVTMTEEPKRFRSSPIISPVYGVEDGNTTVKDNSIALENTANYEKLDAEIKKTNEFLNTLRELQKKLD